MGTRNKIINIAILISFIATMLISLTGCSFVRHSIAILIPTDNFLINQNDSRILYEPGAEAFAERIVPLLPTSIQQIEAKQYQPFAKTVKIYICASRKSFIRLYGADVRAGVLTKLFLSPRIFDQGDEIIKLYLTHELSHLHLLQQLGVYKNGRLPFWFKEGLATYASSGGGAHTVTDGQAIDFIRAGKHFVPNETGGFIFQKTPSDFDLEPHMFYRQSMLFIKYLVSINESEFRKFLLSIEKGEKLPKALRKAYNKELKDLWGDFIKKINGMG